tara:strand:+ start:654 stop:1349 length:696 start_codon:yes stop_codon:yes gene_type:complete
MARRKKQKNPSFEESIPLIDNEIEKRKGRWTLHSLSWLDFEDVSQIIKLHIFKKWHLYNSSQPLAPWLNRIITNQIKNIIRNNYGNYSKPCSRCAAAEAEDKCLVYGKQDNGCPLVAKWEKTKKVAHDVKIAVPLENHLFEVKSQSYIEDNFFSNAQKLHKRMRQVLKPLEWKVYEALYIKNLTEEETAKLVGYKTSEKDRKPGYKQIKNIQKSIICKVKKILQDNEIDIL